MNKPFFTKSEQEILQWLKEHELGVSKAQLVIVGEGFKGTKVSLGTAFAYMGLNILKEVYKKGSYPISQREYDWLTGKKGPLD